jgi:hypothetical protein
MKTTVFYLLIIFSGPTQVPNIQSLKMPSLPICEQVKTQLIQSLHDNGGDFTSYHLICTHGAHQNKSN